MAGVARKEGSEVVRTQVVEVDGARPVGPKPLGKLRLSWPAGSTQVRFWEGRRSRGQRTEGEPRRPPPLTTLEGTGQRAGSGASEEGQATGLGGSEEGKVSGAWGSRRRFCSFIHSFIPALINRVSASLTRLSFAQQIEPTMWGKRWVWREMRPNYKGLDCRDRRPGFGLWAQGTQWLQIRGWAAAPPGTGPPLTSGALCSPRSF